MFDRTPMFCYYKTKVAPTWSAERNDASQGQGQMHYLQVSDGRWSATHSYVSVYTLIIHTLFIVSHNRTSFVKMINFDEDTSSEVGPHLGCRLTKTILIIFGCRPRFM